VRKKGSEICVVAEKSLGEYYN